MRWVMLLVIAGFVGFMSYYIQTNQAVLDQGTAELQEEDVPMMIADMVQTEITSAQDVGGTLSLIVVAFAVFMQLIAWIAAAQKIAGVKKSGSSIDERFAQLEAIEVYFDLPLYLGLLGTVLSFILITIYPEAGLIFAYVSTGIGIVVSVILHLFYLTPYKQELIARRGEMGA